MYTPHYFCLVVCAKKRISLTFSHIQVLYYPRVPWRLTFCVHRRQQSHFCGAIRIASSHYVSSTCDFLDSCVWQISLFQYETFLSNPYNCAHPYLMKCFQLWCHLNRTHYCCAIIIASSHYISSMFNFLNSYVWQISLFLDEIFLSKVIHKIAYIPISCFFMVQVLLHPLLWCNFNHIFTLRLFDF